MNNSDAEDWFLVFPDCAAAARLAAALPRNGLRVVRYGSGRPWLVGHFADNRTTLLDQGPAQVALIGEHAATSADLAGLVRRIHDLSDASRLAAEIDGSFHLAAVIDGRSMIQGTVSALRDVYYAHHAGITLAGSHASALAALVGAPFDDRRLPLYLLDGIPYPLSEDTGWTGVHAVPPDSFLQLDTSGRALIRQWWLAPEPALTLDEGAEWLRAALTAAVRVRTRMAGSLSADLSGGLDSTSLCFLAAREATGLMSFTVRGANAADDAGWATRASECLPGVERIIADDTDFPDSMAELALAGRKLAEPADAIRGYARERAVATLLAGRGSRLHLRGDGGDQIVGPAPSCLHTTLYTNPVVAARQLREYRRRYGWPVGASLRALLDRRSYRSWLAGVAERLTAPGPTVRTPVLGWCAEPRIAPWATRDAVAAAAALIREAAIDAEPLAATHGGHQALHHIQRTGRHCRTMRRIAAESGLATSYPWLDNKVVDAGLVVRMSERATPFEVRPLSSRALRGLLPDELLTRRAIGGHHVEANGVPRRQRDALCALLEDSVLAELGLIDPEAARAAVLDCDSVVRYRAITRTLVTEAWLRGHRGTPAETGTLVPIGDICRGS